MNRTYALTIEADENDSFLITCPSIPGVVTCAWSEGEIDRWATDAVKTMLAWMVEHAEALPPSDEIAPGQPHVRLPLLTSLKLDLYEACRVAGVSRAELARRLGWHREQVDRLFRLRHASRLDQLEAAARAVGREIALDMRPLPARAAA